MQSDSALLRARNAYRIGDYSVARELLEKQLESGGSQPKVHILLGSVLAQQGDIAGAAQEYSVAIEQDRGNADAFNNLGIMYRRLGRFGDALKALRSAITLNPDRADLRYNLANVYKVAGDIDEAAAAYEKSIELDPTFLPAYNNLGNLLAAEGDHTKARDVFQRGLYHDPNHPGLHYNIGLAQEREGDLEAAAESFGRALRSRPGWIDALNNRGVVLDRLGRLEEALRSYQEILRIDPGNAIAHNNAATIQMRRGELDDAVEHLREALRLNPRYEHAASNLVLVLSGRDDRDDVPEILAEVVSAFPDRVDFRRARAESLAARDRLWDAEEELDTVLRLEPDDPAALHVLGLVYFRTGREDEAKECFRRLEAADPEHQRHRLDLARFFVSEERYEEAAHELKNYLERVPGDPDGHLMRADILIARGKVDTAVRLLQKLRTDFPEHGAVLSHLARAYRAQGERDRALRSAEELISLQGNRANPEDLSAINESLAIYEDIVSTYQADHNEAWQRNLEKLGELAREAEESGAEEVKAELEIDELAGLEEDSIPILDFTAEHFEQDTEEDEEEPAEEPDWEALAAHRHYPSLLRMAEGERRDYAPQPQSPATGAGARSYPPPEHPGASPWHNDAEPHYRQPPPPPPYPAQPPPQYPQYPPPVYPPPQYPPP
ncbi:MAG: tetratricopeptide repeat protein, partial [Spirochaetaceae bacterium]